MGYSTLRDCLDDLAATGQLLRIDELVDPYLEVAEIHRRVFQAGGPAILYAQPKGCVFPLVSNLFGSIERLRYIFRDTLDDVRRLVRMKAEPGQLARPARWFGAVKAGWNALPRRVASGPIITHEMKLADLPQVTCWPNDGGAFITLP